MSQQGVIEPRKVFDDGAAYEAMMGDWSRRVGNVFIDWLNPANGLTWLDVGCGSGAFSALLGERCAPVKIHGIDPSEPQIAFARQRTLACPAEFRVGDAQALPYADRSVDAAVMALVIFFVPDPAKGVAEMARVVRPGGVVAAYVWDVVNAGSPVSPFEREMADSPFRPSPSASTMNALRDFWSGAGLETVETRTITVERTFPDFDTLWTMSVNGTVLKPQVAALSPAEVEAAKQRVRARLGASADGSITYSAKANAIAGRVPA